jgi:hypothetical protein
MTLIDTKHCNEEALTPILIDWLITQRWIRRGTVISYEVSWMGRWVDLVTYSQSGSLSAFELKLNHTRRAIEQAAANRLAFDRSYIVIGSRPTAANIQMAQEACIGIIAIAGQDVMLVLGSPKQASVAAVRKRLLRSVIGKGTLYGNV